MARSCFDKSIGLGKFFVKRGDISDLIY
ncbi:protein of unknown function [Cyanobium sp. NIES-981]|nr:protein of unknown function [Cyanobium sp. NIES-981]